MKLHPFARLNLKHIAWLLLVVFLSAQAAKAEDDFVKLDITTYGVDMGLASPLPNYEYDRSYTPKSFDARVENEIQEKQTTDFVIEKSWAEIRKKIGSQQFVNSQKLPN